MHATRNSTEVDVSAALACTVQNSNGETIRFRDILSHDIDIASRCSSVTNSSVSYNEKDDIDLKSSRTLVIFIRHFFCGYCQEYLRSLLANSALSYTNLEEHDLKVKIIGCGAPSLIKSYRAVTKIPKTWQLYADPTTTIYKALGMHRSLSRGDHNPRYVQRSFSGNMWRSMVQGLRRIPQGDAGGAGGWDVQGGEFLFETAGSGEIQLKWSHRMQHSRDHTEVDDLLYAIGLRTKPNVRPSPNVQQHQCSRTMPVVPQTNSHTTEKQENDKPVSRQNSLRRSMSVRRQSWMVKTSALGRSFSVRDTASTKVAG